MKTRSIFGSRVHLSVWAWLIVALSLVQVPPLFAVRGTADSAAVSTATRAGRLAVFDDAWTTIYERYYDPAFRGVDWEAQRKMLRPLAAEAGSGREFYVILRRLIGSLNDTHTRVFAPEEKFDWWNPRFISIGVAVREVGGLPTVVRVDKHSAPERAGLRVGDVIASVDGQPAMSLIQRRLLDQPLTTLHASRARAFSMLFDGSPESVVEVSWKGKDGKQKSARFERRWQHRELGLRFHRERGGYAVVELDAFTKNTAHALVRALKEKLRDMHGIVLDLRGNGGGDTEAMTDLAALFLGGGINLGQFTDRNGFNIKLATLSNSMSTPELIKQSKVPLVILASERTSSASEIFIAAMKAAGRATVMGTESCGCVLAIRTRHTLPDGGVLDVSELDYRTAVGTRLEGQPIQPDEVTVVERSDLYSGRDRALQTALAYLARVNNREIISESRQ